VKLTLAALVLALAVTAGASASPFVKFGLQDDAYLSSGASLEPGLQTLDQLGVGLVRYMVNWRQVATRKPRHPANPGDPAYDWTAVDATLGALHAHGITVLATLVRTPAWANGGLGQNAVPTSKYSLAAFAAAVAKRYPWLRLWEIWNEPNLQSFLKPDSPQLYVQRLLNPAYVELHTLNPANRVAGGATSPRSTSSGLSPVTFMRGMHAARARLDAYSHHPYPVTRGETPSRFARGVCRYCTGVLSLAHLDQLVREVKRDFGPKRIWLTEYGYETNPPDPNGVSWALQSQYLAEAAQRAAAAPYVDMLIQFMLQDEARPNGWQSGLISSTGFPKPAFNSFMLPIAVAARTGRRTTIWGQVRPGAGPRPYELQRLTSTGWTTVGGPGALTAANGTYTRIVSAPLGTRFRVLALQTATPSRPVLVR
jgi:polysaccharide biosynthesis protein PslG